MVYGSGATPRAASSSLARGGFADDLAHPLAVHRSTAQVRDQVVVCSSRGSDAPQAVEMLDDRLDEVERHLQLSVLASAMWKRASADLRSGRGG